MLCNWLNACKLFYILVFFVCRFKNMTFKTFLEANCTQQSFCDRQPETLCVCVFKMQTTGRFLPTLRLEGTVLHIARYQIWHAVIVIVCLSVCVCVCFSVCDHIFRTTCPIFTKFFVHVTPRGIVISYVLPVLLMTSYFLISQGCLTSPASWCALHTQPWAWL